ncbi:MAG: class I SAM-dependent methyltransferase [Pseudomonadota bacterium]
MDPKKTDIDSPGDGALGAEPSAGSAPVIDASHPSDGHFSSAYSLSSREDTLAHYRSWAESYDHEVGDENGYAQPARTAEMLSRFEDLSRLKVLDAGCGSGLSGLALAAGGVTHLDGCDFSPDMLAKARLKTVYNHLFEADLNEPLRDVDDAVYDAVTAVGVFSFGHVAPAACEELARILKPGGFLIVALNEQYWDKGDLSAQLDRMVADGTLVEKAKEFGEHLPGHGVKGWVLALQKPSQ